MFSFHAPLIVHASHEAGLPLGGIGAVLDGMLRSAAYTAAVGRTILAGSLNADNQAEMQRLTAPANRLTIIYSSIHNINTAPPALSEALHSIETSMHVHLLYGHRRFGDAEHEVVLVDAKKMAASVLNGYKFALWDTWRLPSDRYEGDREYQFYMATGEPLYAALTAVTAGMPDCQRYLIAHEWLGMPLIFSALLHDPGRYKTVFYAHEVATARLLVENDAGHDSRFYNVLRAGLAEGHSLDEVFGDQSWYYKHAIIRVASHCDAILAVGDLVVDELRFLGGRFSAVPIDLVYNGVPSAAVSLERKLHSRGLLQSYATNLLGYRPDWVLTHVTRMVQSKGLWRDVQVLRQLDPLLAAAGEQAVVFIVSTANPVGSLPSDIHRWEHEYGWPVHHRVANGDLRDHEVAFWRDHLAPFNASSEAIKVVLVNQFGWSRERCGMRMPAEMTFADLRAGADLEFGQSIYEPFGIAQVESLRSGAISVVSNVCGCVGYVKRAAGGATPPNLIVSDYVTLPSNWLVRSPWDALWISGEVRAGIEERNARAVAEQIMPRLPRDRSAMATLLESGHRLASAMSWDAVVSEQLLPALASL